MTRPSFKMLACATAASAIVVFLTLPAFAGFEWRGAAPSAKPADASAAPASDDASLNGLEPVLSWDGSANKMPAEKVVPVETSVMDTTRPMALVPSSDVLPITAGAPVPYSGSAAYTEPGEIVSGFGSDLPLAIALPQITPPGYQYAFGPGVDAGQRVSWDGGRGWKQVLADALKPSGLGYQVEANTIKILPAGDIAASGNLDSGMQTVSITPPESRIKSGQAAGGEPVTIRRQKPSALAQRNKKTTDVIVPVTPPADLSASSIPSSVPEDTAWDAGSVPQDMTASTGPLSLTKPLEQPDAPAAAASDNIWSPPAPAPQVAAAPVPLSAPPVSGLSAAETLTASMPEEAAEPAAISAPVPALPPQMSASAPAGKQSLSSGATDTARSGWHATRGETLREVLSGWAADAGVELYWSIDYDYKVLKNFDSTQSFEEAVGSILEQFTEARPQPYGQLHQNSKGPKVLVIRSYDLVD